MHEQQYLSDRVDDQISWYNKKSKRNKTWYMWLRFFEILLSITIPFLAGTISANPAGKIAIGILGVFVALVASILNLFKFQENWIEYRTTVESLKHEKYLYLTKHEPSNEENFLAFVERIESLLSKENTNWAQLIKQNRVTGGNKSG